MFWKFVRNNLKNQKCPNNCVLWKSCSENFQEIPRKSCMTEHILKADNCVEYELNGWCFSLKNTSEWVLLMRHHSKKNFPESKPSSKLASKTKCYHNCGCCDDYRTFEQLRRMLQINILNPNRLLLQEMYVTIKILKWLVSTWPICLTETPQKKHIKQSDYLNQT